ncbi:hypothetical protein NW768_003102 [Fusarium equiseti]|uniref:Transmembrane protein n=1 Tax=Fusarium equiseti TaxID=61235 RepID=A0ABQ8RLA3_FUSEQ|nr:hypothetical protein NW768_003102 [Fusarium equiseti]
MRTTDLPSWLWLPLQDNCEWDSPFNMGNCFDEQYHNIFFAMMKMLIDLTRFTTFPFLLFVAGMYAECMATLPMAFLSIITIIPMILLRLIWAEEYHIRGGMGNPVVAYSVKTWIILSTPNIVLWAPSAAFAVSQWVRIVEETIVSLRIQAYSSFDFEILFPDYSAGRVLDSDLSKSGAEAWMKKLVQEDQDQRQSRREEEESVRADQEKMGQASLLIKKLNNETHNAIWRAISKRRPQSILRRQPVLSHRQETELLAEERGLSKTKILAQRYVVVPVDQSTQSAEIAPTGSSPSTPPPPSTCKTTPKKPSSPTATAAAPIPSPITPAREEQRADFSPVREPTPSVVTPRQEVVEPIPSLPSPAISGVGVVSSPQVVDEPIFPLEEELLPLDSLPSPEAAGLEPVQQPSPPEQAAASDAFFIPEIPAELLITTTNESGIGWDESLHQGLFQTTPHISELSTWDPFSDPFYDLLYTPSEYVPESDLDAGLDAMCRDVSQEGGGDHNGNHGEKEEEQNQPGDEMAINVECEDVEMEEQDEGEVQVLTSSQAEDVTMGKGEVGYPAEEEEQQQWINEASWEALSALLDQDDFELGDAPAQAAINQPTQLSVPQLPLPQLPVPQSQELQPQQQASIFHLPLFQPTQISPPDFSMSEQEQRELEMEMEAAFDSEMVDAADHSVPPPPPPSAQQVFPMSFARVEIPPSPLAEASPASQSRPTIPVNEQFQAETEREIVEAHRPIPFETRGNASKNKQRRDELPDPAKPATKEQMEKRRVLKPRVRGARTAAHTLVPGSTTALPTTPSPGSNNRQERRQQQQQTVAPVMMGGLMLPGGNRTITTSTPELVPAAPQTPTISAEQKAAFEKKKAAQIKAQQEARKNKKPSIFHQKRPTTPGRSAPNTPQQTSSPIPQIKDPGERAAAESIFGTPGSGKKNGLVILPSIPDHLRDQVAGHRPENEGED